MTDAVQLALISSIPPTIVAAASFLASMRAGNKADIAVSKVDTTIEKVEEVHKTVNSQLSAALQSAKDKGYAEGLKAAQDQLNPRPVPDPFRPAVVVTDDVTKKS